MSDLIKPLAELCAALIEALGVLLIAGFTLFSLVRGLRQWLGGVSLETVYREVRQSLGRGILLGLEFLVAADIIHTVAVELTLNTVGLLAIVVLIRTFLSFTLELELTGRWPWQDKVPSNSFVDGDSARELPQPVA